MVDGSRVGTLRRSPPSPSSTNCRRAFFAISGERARYHARSPPVVLAYSHRELSRSRALAALRRRSWSDWQRALPRVCWRLAALSRLLVTRRLPHLLPLKRGPTPLPYRRPQTTQTSRAVCPHFGTKIPTRWYLVVCPHTRASMSRQRWRQCTGLCVRHPL